MSHRRRPAHAIRLHGAPGPSIVSLLQAAGSGRPFAFAALSEKLRALLDARAAGSIVLVVEDEPLIQMLTTDHLQELGFHTEVASTAADARSKLKLLGDAVSVALVDVGLPDARGDDLIWELRRIYPTLPLIVASGHNPIELKSKLGKLDRIGYLGKPYTLNTLRVCLKSLGIIHPGSG